MKVLSPKLNRWIITAKNKGNVGSGKLKDKTVRPEKLQNGCTQFHLKKCQGEKWTPKIGDGHSTFSDGKSL